VEYVYPNFQIETDVEEEALASNSVHQFSFALQSHPSTDAERAATITHESNILSMSSHGA
jgi:hypothetical protein